MIQFDGHIFQMDWFNHQLARCCDGLKPPTEVLVSAAIAWCPTLKAPPIWSFFLARWRDCFQQQFISFLTDLHHQHSTFLFLDVPSTSSTKMKHGHLNKGYVSCDVFSDFWWCLCPYELFKSTSALGESNWHFIQSSTRIRSSHAGCGTTHLALCSKLLETLWKSFRWLGRWRDNSCRYRLVVVFVGCWWPLLVVKKLLGVVKIDKCRGTNIWGIHFKILVEKRNQARTTIK